MSERNELEPMASVQSVMTKGGSRQASARSGRIFSTLFFALMVFALLGLLLLGVFAYRDANTTRTDGNDMRLGLSLINNSMRLNDVSGAVGVGEGPEGRSLVLTEALDTGSYETRIYAYQGKIVEEYAAADTAYTPEKAREVVASETFDFEYSDGLLTVYTDQGATRMALRSVMKEGA
ncbi:MAG: DUF4860 domain-containing protein [Raoultibacter sp.]